MLNADVNFQVVKIFISRVKEKAVGLKVSKSIKPGEHFIKIIHDEMISILGRGEKKLKLDKKNSIILYSIVDSSLAKYLARNSDIKKIPCFGVLGDLILSFSKLLNQKASHQPSGLSLIHI